MRRLLLLLLLASPAVLAALPNRAAAGVPSPSNSIVDPCLVVCPLGDIPFTVRVRDLADNPIANSFVEVSFCNAPNIHFCPPPGLNPCAVLGVTDVFGNITFAITAGGITSGTQLARISADGVLLAYREVASPDQDGSLMVNGTDQGILNPKLGSADRTGMLTCDLTSGRVVQADLDALKLHMGHTCGAVVPAEPRSWGNLKLIYR